MDPDFVDMTITSPPYDNLRDYNGYSFSFEKIARELFRITKPGGILVWVVGDSVVNGSETLTSMKQALYFKECGFNMHDVMLYKKTGIRFPEKKRYSQIFEYMFVFSKGVPTTTNIIHDRLNKWAGATVWGKNSQREKTGEMKEVKDPKRYKKYGARLNIWEYSNAYGFGTKDKISYKHPATFPEKMAEDHIITWTNENDIVYDPFIGSGTTAKMSILTNRNYIGSEVSQEYVNGAMERLNGLEDKRGSRLIILKKEEEKRKEEEEEHGEQMKVLENTMGKKKWQPKQKSKSTRLSS
jgi:site-specific DNA-methyltransferase (adenine-specific)